MLQYGKILSGKYSIEFIKPNRPSVFLTLTVDVPGEGVQDRVYLVGYIDNWRPTEDMMSLEVVLKCGDFVKTQFTRLVWWWREYCGFDWTQYTRTGAKGAVYPTYPISELIGREL